MQSMTGYGRAESELSGAQLVVELRSVNHRFLDPKIRVPQELHRFVPKLEELLRSTLIRGRVDMSVRLEAASRGVALDTDRARAGFAALTALRDELSPNEPVPLALLSLVPDLFGRSELPDPDEVEAILLSTARKAVAQLQAMRVHEGARLAADMLARLQHIEVLRNEVAGRTDEVVAQYREKLRQRIAQLLEGSSVGLDEGRLEQEVAHFADRADVAEELTRLLAHTEQFTHLLSGKDEGRGDASTTKKGGGKDDGAVGRRLDFLLQEMNRETNTIGSKCSDAGLAQTVVEMKAELERIREQVQNVL